MCHHDYSFAKNRVKALKIKHCLEAAEMYKMDNFYNYIVIAAVVIVGFVAFIAAICSFKWYMETKKNPCTCCSFFCCCKNRRRRRQQKKRNEIQENQAVNVFEQGESGHKWSPVNLPPPRDEDSIPATPPQDSKNSSVCMSFCLSDPVQDCCEFFDCDIMWRKKSIYTIPIFGKKKLLQRRPTRPAPPPPKAVVLPQVKNPEPVMFEEVECEPVPEAPPSPEPIRTLPQKAMYVDPLAFLQRTFAKNNQPDKEETDETDNKQEALYCKFKNMVLAKVKKSVSMASINKLGISSNPSGVSTNPSGVSTSTKKLKTASLASLHNLDESELDSSYGSKRSLSLASLNMLQGQGAINKGISLDPRSRTSVLSTVSTATDDIPPSARKDEYIDLEEMSKRIEAKMQAARSMKTSPVSSPIPHVEAVSNTPSQVASQAYTPNFMPASAFVGVPSFSSFNYPPTPVPAPGIQMFQDIREIDRPPQYYPPVPASQGRPAVPARTAGGLPTYTMSPSGTLGRPKPAVPPRPPMGDAAKMPSSPRTSTLPRSPRLVKPAGPPPPPPMGKTPIESSI